MSLSANQVIRIHQKTLDALAAHYLENCMDDSEYIRIVRVVMSAAVSTLLEDGASDTVIGHVDSTLREYAREFYVSNCAQNHTEISNIVDYKDDCAAMFDYIYLHGQYPDE